MIIVVIPVVAIIPTIIRTVVPITTIVPVVIMAMATAAAKVYK